MAGYTQGTGSIGTQNGVSALSYKITGLTPSTSYDVYVRKNCPDSQSEWVKHTFSTIAVICPTGNVTLTTQAQVDAFVTNYPGCTTITGNLTINNSADITNLNGLSALTSVGGNLRIINNSVLTDISGLRNIASGITILFIQNNPALSVCHIASVCAFLQGSGNRTISGNATGCENVNAVITACTPAPACAVPANITSTNIVTDKATINWTNSGTFDLEWGLAGYTQGIGSIGTQNGVSALSYQITGLTPSTSYDVYVRQNCTDSQSEWVKHTFSTIAVICPTGNVTLTTQAQVDAFATNYPGCTSMPGNLTIRGATITNLNGLNALTSVGGNLSIESNSNLTNLDGLSALTNVGGFLQIYENSALTNLNGLSALTTVGGILSIQINSNLANLNGLSALTSVGGNLQIYNNSVLTNLNGLIALKSVGGYLDIYGNSALTNLDGLSTLASVGGYLRISNNSVLTDISGLANITSGITVLYIQNNPALSVCHIASVCAFLQGTGNRYISGNATGCNNVNAVITACNTPACAIPANITSTNIVTDKATINWTNSGTFDLEWGLSGYTRGTGSIGTQNGLSASSYQITGLTPSTSYDVYVRQNCTDSQSEWVKHTFSTIAVVCPTGDVNLYTQAQVDAFATTYSGCTTIQGNLYIQGDNITNLNGLSSLTSVGGSLYIYYNPQLTNLNGLSALTTVGGYLYIYGNSVLTNLNGLSALTTVGDLLIMENSQLTNLDGLNALTTVGGYLNISNNSQLTNLDGLSALTSVGGYLQIGYNSALTDISGLRNITSGITELYIYDNTALSVCHIASVCAFLQGSGYRYIAGNATGCDSESAVLSSCGTLSVSDINKKGIMVYPNPVKDILNIKTDKKLTSVSVYNLSGQKIIENTRVSNSKVDVSSLVTGNYIVNVLLENGEVKTVKITKE